MPASAGILPALASALDPPALPLRFGSNRSLRSETAWFPRSRPPLANRRPSATIRQDRTLSQAPGATPAALPRSHRRRLLPPLRIFAGTPLPRLRAEHTRSGEAGQFQPGCAPLFLAAPKRRQCVMLAPARILLETASRWFRHFTPGQGRIAARSPPRGTTPLPPRCGTIPAASALRPPL
jgi:hypothetical protein